MAIKSIICRHRTNGIEEAIESWERAHAHAMQVRDIEDIVNECVWVHDLLADYHAETMALLFGDDRFDEQAEGALMLGILSAAELAFTKVQRQVSWAKQHGYAVDKAESFAEILQHLRALRDDVATRWPFIDPQQVTRARAQLAGRNAQTVEEILGELHAADTPGN